MAATECLYLAAQFEVSGDRIIIQDAEAVDDGEGFARPLDNVFGLQFQVRLVRYGEDHRLGPVQCGLEILLDTKVLEVFLGAEKTGPRMPGSGVRVLALQLVPVLDLGVVHAHLGALVVVFSGLPNRGKA